MNVRVTIVISQKKILGHALGRGSPSEQQIVEHELNCLDFLVLIFFVFLRSHISLMNAWGVLIIALVAVVRIIDQANWLSGQVEEQANPNN